MDKEGNEKTDETICKSEGSIVSAHVIIFFPSVLRTSFAITIHSQN